MTNRAYFFCVSSLLIAVGFTLCFNSGCKPSQKKIETQQAEVERIASATFDEIAKLESQQKFTEAEEFISSALKKEALSNYRDRLLARKSELLIRQDKTSAAEELILSYIQQEPLVVQSALNDLLQFYHNNKEYDKCITLSDRLLASDAEIPETMIALILNQHLAAAIGTEEPEKEKAAIDHIMASIKESSVGVNIIESRLGELTKKKKFSEAMALATHLQTSASSNDSYKNLASLINIQCITGSRKWTELKPAYEACLKQLPDRELSKVMRHVFNALQKAKNLALLRECAKKGAWSTSGKQRSIDYAARKWIEAEFINSKASLPSSLKKLQTTSTSPSRIASIFDRFFYEVARDKNLIKQLCAIGTELIDKCADENINNSLKVKILDGSFIIEDYDLTVSMLEQGIPDKDAAWHAMSLAKVKAHRAQKQNKPRDAVKYYREFMSCWENSEKEEEFDPTSGIAYSKEWILARNATRIAGILDSIPDKAEAEKVRKEARGYFKIAIEKAENDEAALKLVTEEAEKAK